MRRLALVLFSAAVMLAGCGYHLAERTGTLPQGVDTLYVQMFTNHTPEPYLENLVTNAVVSRLSSKNGVMLVENPNSADAVLSGEVTGYSVATVAYNSHYSAAIYRTTITVLATLKRADGKVLWKGSVDWSENFNASSNKNIQDDNETAVQKLVADRLAQDLYARMTDNF
ncbi:MAG TPA: LPS assembly lipoprotein LptE [Desulfuromonadales bacterium]|nr:LPS assembly lipoprotein LptE [Desulfuromonadales bacterium]